MAAKPVYLTQSGIEKMKARLEYLTSEKRTEIANRIKTAIALGDLSENSEYIESKNDQAFLEGEIVTIKADLRHVHIIKEEDIDGKEVIIGAKVVVFDIDANRNIEYNIVGQNESDPFSGKISNESPIGIALIGQKKEDIVKVTTPRGVKQFKIIDIHS